MKSHKHCWAWAVMLAGLAFILQVPSRVRAQDTPAVDGSQGPQDAQNSEGQDPPSRIARLDYMEGAVSLQPGGENDWVTAVLNRPLATGDNLWADEGSRAEVHLGSTALRLGPKTGISLLEVSDHAAQIRLAQGSLVVNVRHVDGEDSYEVDTPNVAFTALQAGNYRIDVNADGNRTEVTVWHGRAEVTGGGSTYTVVAGQSATFNGSDHLDYDLGQGPANDGFDRWALDRDQNEERSESANYVSREMTGYEDLDANGDWSYVEGYGMCWRPTRVVTGWAPYRFGRWISVAPWGWTWVEDEPWGFAPFHYGRWALAGNGWVWVPGPTGVRPVYAPALVGWVGGGPGFRFSAGAGVGWFPLGPGEVFIPGYRVSRAYVNRANTTNTAVNITRITSVYNTVVVNRNGNNITYANRNVSGGVTVVSRDTFVNARPVARNVVWVPSKELAAAPLSHMVAVEPSRKSVLGSGGPVANRPPAAVMNRPVVALRTPAPMPRSFDQRQAEAGEHLSPALPSPQSLVRQQAPGRPVPVVQTRQPRVQSEFQPVSSQNTGNNQAKPQPRVWEAQGTPEPEPTQSRPESRNAQTSGNSRSPQRAGQPAQPGSRPVAKPVSAVQTRRGDEPPREPEPKSGSAQQPKPTPAPPAPRQQNSHPPASHPVSAPKK